MRKKHGNQLFLLLCLSITLFQLTVHAQSDEIESIEKPTSSKNDEIVDQISPVEAEGDPNVNIPASAETRSNDEIREDFKRFANPTFNKAVKYFFQKKFEMAEFLLQKELESNPENYFAYSYLGDIFLFKNKYDEAITLYKRAIDLQPSNAENHFRLGQAYYYKGIGNLAIEHFERAYQLNPNIKYTQYHIGLAYLMILRNKKKTIEYWEIYIALSPEDPQYEKISRAIELLKDPNFVIPPVGSEIPLDEALHLGGAVLKQTEREDTNDTSAGHEEKKSVDDTVDIERDDAL